MPSGAKKRKAAKKKKEAHTSNNSNNGDNGQNNNPRGNDDARSQDERDSDGGDAISPVSQDHQPPFSEEPQGTGNEEGSKEVAVDDNTVIKMERDFSEKDAESKVHVERVESTKEPRGEHSRSSSSSSSSSSDDESHSHQKKWNEEDDAAKLKPTLCSAEEKEAVTYSEDAPKSFDEKPVMELNCNSVAEDTPPVDMSKSAVPLSEVAERVTDSSAFQSTEVLEVVDLGVQLNDGKFFPETDKVASADAGPQEKDDDKDSPKLDENDGQSLKAETENGSKTLVSSYRAAESSSNVDDLPDGTKDEELPTSNMQTAQSGDVAPKAKDSESRESTSEDQPLIDPAPRVAQRTSWMSCCGILDIFSGSGR